MNQPRDKSVALRVSKITFVKTLLTALLLLALSVTSPLDAQKSPPSSGEPQLLSAFPAGGQLGTTFNVTIRGSALEGAYAASFDSSDVHAEIQKIEAIELSDNASSGTKENAKQPGHEVLVVVRVSPSAKIGPHRLRLVS